MVFHIQMFGLNENGETCSLYIRDFKPFIYIKIGENWDGNDREEFMDNIIKTVEKKVGAKLRTR